MKIALVGVLVFGAFALGWWVRGEQEARKGGAAAPVVTREDRAAAEAVAQKCRDDCEQRNVIQKLGDDWLRNCRFTCSGPPKPYEPIRSITVAPADHKKR